MASGQHVLEPGLLARAHRGILLVDDCHLLDESVASQLWNALTDGYVTVEREGLSVRYPCQPRLVLAAYNPDEGDVREHWLDRVSMVLPMTTNTLTIKERVEAVLNVEGFRDQTEDLTSAMAEEEDVRETVAKARELLPYVKIERQQLVYLCEEASRADCEGQRAEIFAVQIAKTAAALNGRIQVQASDLELGVMLAIVPRAHAPFEQEGGESVEETSTSPPDSPQQPLPPDKPTSDTPLQDPPDEQADADDEPEEDSTDQNQEQDEPTADETQATQEQQIAEEFLFGVEHANLDPRLLSYKRHTKKGKGGKRARMFNLQRGHFVKAIFPRGDWKMGRIAVGATLRAAAPYQLIRRARAGDGKLIHVRNGDFRIKRLARKAGSLIIFVVDASGSMALNRMGTAKGAAMSLLKEAYKSRDKICLIAFHGQQADVVVPPTKSMALTRARLEAMPCGGRSPLAHGLTVATRTGLNAIKVKQDVGKVIVVLISDGRPTVPLCISEGEEFDALTMDPSSKDGEPSRSFCKNEVLAIARKIGSLKDIDLLVVDTEDKFVGTGISSEIAKHGQGTYEHLDSTDVYSVDRITKQHIERVA
jgi:magnesium chelatase subunit D